MLKRRTLIRVIFKSLLSNLICGSRRVVSPEKDGVHSDESLSFLYKNKRYFISMRVVDKDWIYR